MKSLRPVLWLFVLPAALIALFPVTPGVLLYDRPAILHGEWWRLWTGHWVHFSASHLFWNLLVLVVASWWLEKIRPGLLLRFTLVAAPLISLGLILFAPAMDRYGGLSGLGTAVVSLLALTQVRTQRSRAAWWLGVLALVVGKIAFDAMHSRSLFGDFPSPAIHVSALAHAVGLAVALAASGTILPPLEEPAREHRHNMNAEAPSDPKESNWVRMRAPLGFALYAAATGLAALVSVYYLALMGVLVVVAIGQLLTRTWRGFAFGVLTGAGLSVLWLALFMVVAHDL